MGVSQSQLDNQLKNYIKGTELDTKLGNYATVQQLTSATGSTSGNTYNQFLNTLKTDLNMSNYATKSELSKDYTLKTDLSNYVQTSRLNDFALRTELNNYATITSTNNFVSNSTLNTKLTDYYDKNEVDTILGAYLKQADYSQFATKAYADEKIFDLDKKIKDKYLTFYRDMNKEISTTSTNYVPIDDMTLTLPEGRYEITFSASEVGIVPGNLLVRFIFSVYDSGGSLKRHRESSGESYFNFIDTGRLGQVSFTSVVQLGLNEVLKVAWRTTGGTAYCGPRTIIARKIDLP